MNTTPSTPQTTTSQSPIIPALNPQMPIGPNTPLALIILITALLNAIATSIQANANLLKSLNDLIKTHRRRP